MNMKDTYPKPRKVKVFYEALTINKSKILGNSPPPQVKERFDAWVWAIKTRHKWALHQANLYCTGQF
jgi:hypothetical protein